MQPGGSRSWNVTNSRCWWGPKAKFYFLTPQHFHTTNQWISLSQLTNRVAERHDGNFTDCIRWAKTQTTSALTDYHPLFPDTVLRLSRRPTPRSSVNSFTYPLQVDANKSRWTEENDWDSRQPFTANYDTITSVIAPVKRCSSLRFFYRWTRGK